MGRNHGHSILITEFDPVKVDEARRIARHDLFAHVRVSHKDLRELDASATFDQVLAVDVLEHIDDDQRAIRQIAEALTPGGRLVVSVPTPRYPATFGRTFTDHLGHVRDGYWLEDLEPKLAAVGLNVESHRYYTLRWVSLACRLFYNSGIPYPIGVLWAPLARKALRVTERRGRTDAARQPRSACRQGSRG